ncbi:MAG TPA: hypothetical protein VLC95_20080 [Anaerolineae bacterium]|nr:hypothetical protein [Anaerolineae bacterium]
MNIAAAPSLRPMRVPELMDATIRLYRKNFLLLLATVAVVHVPLLAIDALVSVPVSLAQEEMLGAALTTAPYDGTLPPGVTRVYLWAGLQLAITLTLGFVGGTLMTSAVAWSVSERHLDRPLTLGQAYRAVARRWRSVLGAAALTVLIYLGLYVVLIVPCIGQIVGIPALIFAYVCLRFVPQAVMLEELGARESIRRSWFLTKPHFWRVAGIVGLLWLLGMLISAGPTYLATMGTMFVASSVLVRSLVSTAASGVVNLIYLPIRLTGETLVYYDLRVRREGLDLEMELDALQLEPAGDDLLAPEDAPPPAVAAVAGQREPFLTKRDWRNLGLLLGVGLVVVVVCCGAYFAFTALLMGPAMRQVLPSIEQALTATAAPSDLERAMEELRRALTATPMP